MPNATGRSSRASCPVRAVRRATVRKRASNISMSQNKSTNCPIYCILMNVTSKKLAKFNDYEGFVKKFKPKLTTDDCYTPPVVYDALLKWIDANIMSLSGVKVLRPFFPGGDYENFDYPAGSVVIDNPPFSILAKILRFYNEKGIKYFLFAPAITQFSSCQGDCTYIVANARIRYHNGASIPTSFNTNLVPDGTKIMLRGDLKIILDKACQESSKKQRKIVYPDNVVSPATLFRLVNRGLVWHIPASHAHFVRKLDNAKTGIYGGGFLLSERAAAERAAAESIELSERELEIIKSLG